MSSYRSMPLSPRAPALAADAIALPYRKRACKIVPGCYGREAAVGDEQVMTSETHPIYVDFVPDEHTKVSGRLGMTFAPGMKARGQRGRWDRDLEADLRVLREQYGAGVLVSVIEEHEYHGYKIPELFERDTVEGIEVLRFAIEDMNVPKEAEAEEYAELTGAS